MVTENPQSEPPPGSEDNDPLIGRTVAGRYEILSRIGRGGMGVVYLAQQSTLSRKVVIKVLAPDLVNDTNALARFEREARGLSRLQHPNIVTIFDFGRDGDLAFIAMEFVQGETLSRHLKTGGPMKMNVFAPIASQILKGIGEAHKLGLIHRDLKPTNLMLCDLEGRANFVKILDFGLAKLIQNPTEVTKEQHLVGSAAFLAPEQILNCRADARSDVYALGVLFFLMLSGHRPFKAENDAVLLYKHVNEDPPLLLDILPEGHDVPDGVAALIQGCLAKDPEHRPADANALLHALTGGLSSSQINVPYMTGEFAALPPQEYTPISGAGQTGEVAPSESTPSGFSRVDTLNPQEFSRSMGGQSVVMMAPPSSKRNLFVAIVVGSIVLTVVLFTVLQTMSSQQTTSAEGAADTQELAEVFRHVEELIKEERWGKAEILLDSIANSGNNSPSEIEQLADFRDQIAVGRLLAEGNRLETANQLDQAMGIYRQVLERDSSHEAARQKLVTLAKLKNARLQKDFGVLAIDSDEPATVYIDGRESGPSPISIELPPGVHGVKVVATDLNLHAWSDTLEVVVGETMKVKPIFERGEVSVVETNATKKKDRKHRDKDPVSAATLTEPTESETAKVPVEKVVEEDTKPGQKNNNELESAGKKDTDDLLMPVGTKKKTNDAPTAEKNDDGGLLMPIGKKN
ncbi:MAG: hypothetical protein AUK47_02015 [Deltaproteobacteria bacterium CG2_30_63_29]|nr:MAG: hypothetical protein AUK47_02015 [Deltaproteobacteria bacterium CG2_30_63_29]PJB42379.1 MAG: hypothetical protein CO108_11800 [Deltaproteobacteria bacterium CG_4_9_14_3_um_filter_63_12]